MTDDNTRLIPVGIRGHQAIVDAEDYDFLMQWKWSYDHHGYAYRNIREKGKYVARVAMHQLVNKTPAGFDTDHINGNGLDNRKLNLRTVTRGQNLRNKGKLPRNTSGFKGVNWSKAYGFWGAEIVTNRKKKFLGYFDHILEAADAYNKAALLYHGEYARLNTFSAEQESELALWLATKPQKRYSKHRGVSYHKTFRKWVARAYKDKKSYFIGYFDTESAAARAYNAKSLELHGDNARLNQV